MADSIKGKTYENYTGDLRQGILLHRRIDSFTDSHPIVFQSAHRLFEKYRHYNGVIVDVFYDHFLAKNWKDYHPQDLTDYVTGFYQLIDKNFNRLPPQVQHFFPYMKRQNWLLSYATIEGIEQILRQMSSRIKIDTNLDQSVVELQQNYTQFENEFKKFFPELEEYVKTEKKNLV